MIFLLLLMTGTLAGQELRPTTVLPLDFEVAVKGIARRNYLDAKMQRTVAEEKELLQLFNQYSELYESAYQTMEGGCSWYCGDGPFSVTASSSLPTTGKFSYGPENAHDFSHETAWVEGAEGPGIGEYLEYRFNPAAPRITSVIISNGYVKTERAWRANGRIKRLKVYENGAHLADLILPDERAECYFTFAPLGRREDGKELVLRFEIAEVYPGEKYSDTVISELYFDGIDVH